MSLISNKIRSFRQFCHNRYKVFSMTSLVKFIKFPYQRTALNRASVHIEAKIASLGYKLADKVMPKGNYVPYTKAKGLIYVAGHLPVMEDDKLMTGRLGENVSLEEGKHAAKLATLQIISTLRLALGDLDKVKKIVKVYGIVNSTLDFTRQAEVMNGCSDTFGEIFGQEVGSHARTSIGTSVLPLSVPIEIEAIVEYHED